MMFANIDPTSLGNVKVVKWLDNLTPLEVNTLNGRGMVRAHLASPVVSTVTITFLVREKTPHEVAETCRKVSNWLWNAGKSRLISDREPQFYYFARCTALSDMEFTGSSVKLTATMQCSDFRQYSVASEAPIIDVPVVMDNITFAGKHCYNDYGLIFVLKSMDAVPAQTIYTYEISGMDGSYRSPGKKLETKTLKGTFYLVKKTSPDDLMSSAETLKRLHDIAGWLVNDNRQPLIFDADPGKAYQADVDDASSFKKDAWENGSAEVAFTLQPYSENTMASTFVFTLAATSVPQMVPLSGFITGYEIPFIVSIKNNSATPITTVGIRAGNVGSMFTISGVSVAQNETIVIDTNAGTVTKGTTDYSDKAPLTMDYPYLKPADVANGVYAQYYPANAADVTITCKGRWL